MTSTRFAAISVILLLCSTSISCSCFDKFGNADLGLIRDRRRADIEENALNDTVGAVRANIENSLDSPTSKEGFFKSFDLTKTARRLLPSSEDLKNICKNYLGSYETIPATEVPQPEYEEIPSEEEYPMTTDITPSDDNETIAEDHVEDDEGDQGGKFGPYGYYQSYYPGYHTGGNYGANPIYSNGYHQSGGHRPPKRPKPKPGHGYPPPNYMPHGYGMPPGMRPGYGAHPGYGMHPGQVYPGQGYPGQGYPGHGGYQGHGGYPGGHPGYNMGHHPGYPMPPPHYMQQRPSGYARPPPHHGQHPPPMMSSPYGVPPGAGGGYNNIPGGYRPPPPQQHVPYGGQGYPPPNGPPPHFAYPESDTVYGKPPQAETPSEANITHPPGYLGNSCSVHESDSVPNTYGSTYGHSLPPNQNYPPYYANPYGPPQQNRGLRPLPTLAYTFCQYLVGKNEEKEE